MILHIPVQQVIVKSGTGENRTLLKVVNGFVRASVNDHDQGDFNVFGNQILISNPLSEWAIDMINRGNIGTTEPIFIDLITQPVSNPPDGTGTTPRLDNPCDFTENDVPA